MDDYLKQQTQDKITNSKKICVAISQALGFDGLASGLALYLSLSKLGKTPTVLGKSPSVDEAMKLYGVGKIGSKGDKQNLVINIQNAATNVDKVTYALEGKNLKVVVHALPNSFGISQNDISFSNEALNPDLIIAIGYNSIQGLKNDFTHEQSIDSNVFLININKTQVSENFAQINILEEGATGVSEVVARLLQELALPVDEDIAYNLYSGISSSTQNFSPSLTSPASFEVAQWLIKFGAGKASFATGQAQAIKNQPVVSEMLQQAPQMQNTTPITQTVEESAQEDWLKPPKIYHGAKSFDTES